MRCHPFEHRRGSRSGVHSPGVHAPSSFCVGRDHRCDPPCHDSPPRSTLKAVLAVPLVFGADASADAGLAVVFFVFVVLVRVVEVGL